MTVFNQQPSKECWGFFFSRMADHAPPSVAMEAVLKASCDLPENMLKIRGYDFNQGVDLHAVLKSYHSTGFQASSFGLAIQEINNMVSQVPDPLSASWSGHCTLCSSVVCLQIDREAPRTSGDK